MSDYLTCKNCEEITHIGGLVGEKTNDCPKCGKQVLFAPKPVQEGAIGVFTLEDSGRLYKLESIKSGLYYLRSIDGPLCFKTCLSWHFWPLIDNLP
jgi:hypothetical protein